MQIQGFYLKFRAPLPSFGLGWGISNGKTKCVVVVCTHFILSIKKYMYAFWDMWYNLDSRILLCT